MKQVKKFRNGLSSQVSLSIILTNLYRLESAYERSLLTRFEKLSSETLRIQKKKLS